MSLKDLMKNFFGKNGEIDDKTDQLSRDLEDIKRMLDKKAKVANGVIVMDLPEIKRVNSNQKTKTGTGINRIQTVEKPPRFDVTEEIEINEEGNELEL